MATKIRPFLPSTCTVLNGDGEPCGRPGGLGLPLGVCQECAIRIFRAVARMIDLRRVT